MELWGTRRPAFEGYEKNCTADSDILPVRSSEVIFLGQSQSVLARNDYQLVPLTCGHCGMINSMAEVIDGRGDHDDVTIPRGHTY
jgi:hypothetical protein